MLGLEVPIHVSLLFMSLIFSLCNLIDRRVSSINAITTIVAIGLNDASIEGMSLLEYAILLSFLLFFFFLPTVVIMVLKE